MRKIGNYSNICFPRAIDNTYSLNLNGLSFQEDNYENKEGYSLVQRDGNSGEMTLGFPRIGNDRIYEVSPLFPAENGHQFNTFINAITQIEADRTAGFYPVLIAYPGTYSEPQLRLGRDLTIFSYSRSWGPGVTLILNEDLTSNITNEAFILMNTGTNIKGLDIRGVQLCNKLIQRDEDEAKGGPSFIYDTIMSGSPICLYVNNSDFTVDNCRFRDDSKNNAQIGDVGIEIASGSLRITGGDITSRTNPPVMDGVRIDVPNPPLPGPTPTIIIDSVIFRDLDICIDYRNGETQIIGCLFDSNEHVIDTSNATVLLEGSTDLSLNNSVLTNNTDDININEFVNFSISGSILDGTKMTIDPYVRNNIAISYIESNVDKSKGLHVEGNLILGSQRRPTFLWTAQGSGSPEATSYFKYDPTNGFTDVTADLKPSGNGNITLFDDLTNGEFYFACGTKFYSTTYTISQIISDTSAITIQYYNGSGWVNSNYMVSQSLRPYGMYATSIFNAIDTQEVRFNIQNSADMALITINGVEKYYMRMILNTTITQSPIVDTFKIIYSTSRTDDEGIITSFGNARVYKTLLFDLNLIKSPGSAATRPADQDLYLGANSRLGRTENSMGQGDIIGGCFFAPIDMDTSTPIRFIIAFCSSATTATQPNFTLTLTTGVKKSGDRIYFSQATATGNPIRSQQQQTLTLTPNQTDGRNMVITEFSVPASFLIPRDSSSKVVDLYSFDMLRNNDTNGNDLVLVNISFKYYSWNFGSSYI